jgi:S-DNA-T family DNA segregation ATPase FtsK/SpoIIIE
LALFEREEGARELSGEEVDELYRQAVDLVVTTRQASISMIQRRLRVGYNRAARMIEQMEEEGIVSPMESGKPREVLRERGERLWPERG